VLEIKVFEWEVKFREDQVRGAMWGGAKNVKKARVIHIVSLLFPLLKLGIVTRKPAARSRDYLDKETGDD